MNQSIASPVFITARQCTGPPPDLGPRGPSPNPASDIWWPSLETCSNLFIGPHCTGPLLRVLTSSI